MVVGTGFSVSVCLWHPGHLHLPAVMYSESKAVPVPDETHY